MMPLLRCSTFIFLGSLLLNSCGDDPKTVAKFEAQKIEITKLKGELLLIEEKLKNLPPDVSKDLAKSKVVFEKQSSEISQLETEVSDLEAKKRKLQADYDAYKLRYQLK
jgi:molecular chaperone GrpE (heat shock protein)